MSGTLAAPYGRATVVDGGFRVTGRWPYGSGCQNADWLGFTDRRLLGDQPRLDADGLPEQRIVVVPASTAIIHDTWHVSGLRGTGSHDVELQDVFVPDGWTFWWTETPPHPGPLYKHRWWLLAHGAQRLGVARAAIDALYELAQVKTPTRSDHPDPRPPDHPDAVRPGRGPCGGRRAPSSGRRPRSSGSKPRPARRLDPKDLALARLANTNASVGGGADRRSDVQRGRRHRHPAKHPDRAAVPRRPRRRPARHRLGARPTSSGAECSSTKTRTHPAAPPAPRSDRCRWALSTILRSIRPFEN